MEVAAEVYDMVVEDLKDLYPQLIPFVKIRVIELMDHVLSAYDRKIGEYTAQLFKRNGIELVCLFSLCDRTRSRPKFILVLHWLTP